MAHCGMVCNECADICLLTAKHLAAGSHLAEQWCRFCAEICEACAAECEKHGDEMCKRCAEECRRCAEECRRMAGATA